MMKLSTRCSRLRAVAEYMIVAANFAVVLFLVSNSAREHSLSLTDDSRVGGSSSSGRRGVADGSVDGNNLEEQGRNAAVPMFRCDGVMLFADRHDLVGLLRSFSVTASFCTR